MSLPSLKAMAINAGVLLVIGTGAVVFVRGLVFTPGLAGCTGRYARSIEMNIKRDGRLMSPSDIQASAAGRDMMVMENLTFKALDGAPAPAGLVVTTKTGSSQADNERGTPGGISFPWQPRTMPKNLTAACLTYSVFLPADFEFDYVGTLPGLFGTSPSASDGERFSTHLTWQERGMFGTHVSLTTRAGWLTELTDHDRRAGLPRGQWFKVEQEVLLNTPGQVNGQVRLWIDGALRSELKTATLRNSADAFVEGVMADVYFGGLMLDGRPMEGKARKDEAIRLTPFQIRWN